MTSPQYITFVTIRSDSVGLLPQRGKGRRLGAPLNLLVVVEVVVMYLLIVKTRVANVDLEKTPTSDLSLDRSLCASPRIVCR